MNWTDLVLLAGVALASATGSTLGGEPGREGRVLTLVAFGDSTTARRGSLRIYLECLKNDLPKQGMKVATVNAGLGGNTTQAARGRFSKDVLDRRPDICVIQFGINDAAVDVWKTPPATRPRVTIDDYTSNLEHFVEALRARHCRVILVTPNPMRWTPALKKSYGKPPYRPDDPDGFNVRLQRYADCVRGVAQRKKVALVDVYAAFQAYGTDKGKSVEDLLLDGMHPNEKGHRLVADLLVKELLRPTKEATEPDAPADADKPRR